jgi:hypothetical protein
MKPSSLLFSLLACLLFAGCQDRQQAARLNELEKGFAALTNLIPELDAKFNAIDTKHTALDQRVLELAGGAAIGRYQLVPATVEFDGVSTANVFKIDTQTGHVSRLMQATVPMPSGGTHISTEGFMKVSDDINEALNEAFDVAKRAKELAPSAKRAIEAQRSPRP